jgi:hypothetical protein
MAGPAKRVDIRAILTDPVKRKHFEDALARSVKAVPLDGTHAVPTITRILNFGTWTVKLSCGCAIRGLSSDDLNREQLYIGKAVYCGKHTPKVRP